MPGLLGSPLPHSTKKSWARGVRFGSLSCCKRCSYGYTVQINSTRSRLSNWVHRSASTIPSKMHTRVAPSHLMHAQTCTLHGCLGAVCVLALVLSSCSRYVCEFPIVRRSCREKMPPGFPLFVPCGFQTRIRLEVGDATWSPFPGSEGCSTICYA